MKKHLLIALVLSGMVFNTNAQNQERVIPCYTEEHFQEMAKQDPSLILKRAAMDLEVDNYLKEHNNLAAKTSSSV